MCTLSYLFGFRVSSFSPGSTLRSVACSQTLILETAHLSGRRQMSWLKAWDRTWLIFLKCLIYVPRSQICILFSGVECQYKYSIYAEPDGEGKKKNPHSTSLFRVCFENRKHYLKGHPISSSRWIGKKDSGFYK